MIKNSAAILVWSTNAKTGRKHSALRELLFTPAIKWVSLALDELGFKNTLIQGGKEIDKRNIDLDILNIYGAELADWLKDCKESDILVLGADAPLIESKNIIEAQNKHTGSSRKITLFADGNRYFTGAGWYNREALIELVKFFKEDFNLIDLYDEIKEVGFATSSYVVKTAAIMPVGSEVNLNQLSLIARNRIINKHLKNGVEIMINDGIIISPEATIGEDTTVLPSTIIRGKTSIGNNCEIGASSVIIDSTIGDNSRIISSQIEQSIIGECTTIGPMSRVRPNSAIGNNTKIGNFVEIKNSIIGDKTAISHLTYVGDSDVGKGCNIGCGVVTVNYNGKDKNRTVIKDNVFVGCNCNLVAPVTLEDGVYAAAGTTITENVPADSLVIGRAKQTVKEGWAKDKSFASKKKG